MRAKLLLVVSVAACGGAVAPTNATDTDPATTIESPTTAVETTAEPATTTTERATTTSAAPDAAPPELAGRWRPDLAGEPFVLWLVGTNYSFRFPDGAIGSGKFSVEGNRIRFYDALIGPGDGFYEWLTEGDTLTFAVLEPSDPIKNGEGNWSG